MPDSSARPSPFSLNLIRWFCREELVEELQGNLHEYHATLDSASFKKLKYWYQVINYLRPSTLKIFKLKTTAMFNFNPVITLRSLYRHKSTSLINISGFTLGLVAAFFLYFYIHSELSYDSLHEDGDRIYRVKRVSEINGTPYTIGVTSVPYAAALKNDFPSTVQDVTRAWPESGLVAFEDKKFFEDKIMFADDNFFEFFSFPLKYGDASSAIRGGNKAVISQEIATKYFGDQDPIGKIFEVDNQFNFVVTGILEETQAKSHLDFDMVFANSVFEEFDWFDGWWNNMLITYVKVNTPEEAENIQEQFPGFMDKYMGEDFKRSGNRIDLMLEPLEDVYFNGETRYDEALHGNFQSVSILALVAIAILFVACFNYVNLSIAQSFIRAKEVGVRKVLGVKKGRLILQFLSESLAVLTISILASIGISELLRPVFNSFFDLEVSFYWLDPGVLLFFFIMLTSVLIASGLYPAMLVASFKPITVLKGGKSAAGKSVMIRKGLVVTQFAISIFMIVATVLIGAQAKFMNSKDLGFDKEAVLLVDLNNGDIRSKREEFKEALKANSNVLEVSSLSGEPGGFHDATTLDIAGFEGNPRVRTVFTDINYLNLFDIEVVAGRNFSKDISTDETQAMMLNEKALNELGMTAEEILGRRVVLSGWNGLEFDIVGIAANYNFNSLRDEIEPLAIMTGSFHRKVAVKMNTKNISDNLLFIDETFKTYSPAFPINYRFLDEKLAALYENEQKQIKIFASFSGISIFLACLGIFGLAAYSSQQRQKELGIRKVLGASPKQIIGLISKEFLVLVVVAAIVAIPAVWMFMEQWLDDFAYRIRVADNWYVMIFGGVATMLIALFTVTIKTYRAAISDPTESIRNE